MTLLEVWTGSNRVNTERQVAYAQKQQTLGKRVKLHYHMESAECNDDCTLLEPQ